MVFRPEVVRKKLEHLDQTLATLGKLRRELSLEDVNQDTESQWKVERGLQLACQLVLDIGDHILSAKFGQRVDEYEMIVAALRSRGVIAEELARRLQGLGGFRNIIVHEYGELDYGILYDRLQNGLTDFEDFVRAILAFLKNSG